GNAGLDDLVVGNSRLGAHHGRLHDALAVDDAAEAPRPRRVDEAVDHPAAVEGGDVATVDRAVVGDDDGHRRVELPKAAQHPVLAPLLVLAGDAHRPEQLLGDLDLSLAVHAGVAGPHAELPGVRNARDVALDIALADAVEHLAGNHAAVPRQARE